jgi:FixJ family two-component response regulator
LQDRNIVLVVDDDPGVRAGVERFLRAHAYEPILFSSAEAFRNHTDFDTAVCVILDIDLGDGSGIELRHGLTAAGVSVPVIYITGNVKPAVREAALGSGCIAFLTKPFSARELIEPLNSAAAASHIASMKETFPHFEPQMTKSGRWFVSVKTGNGPDSHVGDFGSEAEATRWISTKSKYWPGKADETK